MLCRIRPLLPREEGNSKPNKKGISTTNNNNKSGVNLSLKLASQHKLKISSETYQRDLVFNFDRILEPSEGQEAVSEEVSHLVTSCLDGFNVCIMAYG